MPGLPAGAVWLRMVHRISSFAIPIGHDFIVLLYLRLRMVGGDMPYQLPVMVKLVITVVNLPGAVLCIAVGTEQWIRPVP